jgi:hypothetical protein
MTIDFYDTEDMTLEQLKALSQDTIVALLDDCTKEIQTLEDQYFSGDRDMYPPDWYDQYVFPVQSIKRRLETCIKPDPIDTIRNIVTNDYEGNHTIECTDTLTLQLGIYDDCIMIWSDDFDINRDFQYDDTNALYDFVETLMKEYE